MTAVDAWRLGFQDRALPEDADVSLVRSWHLGRARAQAARPTHVDVERQGARDVAIVWADGDGAPLVTGVVPGDPSTYPAEGEPIGRDEL